MEYVLILVTQLCILGFNTILPRGLTHNRPNQSTPHQTLWITTYQIYECFLLTQHSLLYFQPPTMLPQQPSSCTARHYYIYSFHGDQNTPPFQVHHFRLIYTHHHLLPNKAYQHDNQSNLLMGCTISRSPFPVSRRFTNHRVHTVATIL